MLFGSLRNHEMYVILMLLMQNLSKVTLGEFKVVVRGTTGSDLDQWHFSSAILSPFLIEESSWLAEEYATWCISGCVRPGSWFVHAVEGQRDDGVDLRPGQFCQCHGIQHQQEAWSLCTRLHHDTQQHTCNTDGDQCVFTLQTWSG